MLDPATPEEAKDLVKNTTVMFYQTGTTKLRTLSSPQEVRHSHNSKDPIKSQKRSSDGSSSSSRTPDPLAAEGDNISPHGNSPSVDTKAETTSELSDATPDTLPELTFVRKPQEESSRPNSLN
jgi:hypothetical protein